jgi:hypothetical protein
MTIVMLHRRPRTLVAFALIPVGLALAWTYIWPADLSAFIAGGWGANAWTISQAAAFPRVRYMVIIMAFAIIVAGLFLGRPIARLTILAVLPPRARGALSALWLADNRPPPRTRA